MHQPPVHIPVISDILNAIGVPDFSMLDALCWIVAVPVTIGYKIAMAASGKGHLAPFPDNAETAFLITTKDFAVLSAAFAPTLKQNPGPIVGTIGTSVPSRAVADGPITMSPTATEAVFVSLHCASGFCGWVSAFVDAFESLTPTQLVSKPLNAACVASAIVGGVSRAAANVLVPKYPLTDELTRAWSIYFSGLFVMNKVCWGHAGLTQAETDKRDYRAISAGLDAVLVIPALVITCLHFADLAKKDAGNERSIAILDETSFMATYVGRVLYTLVVTGALDSDEEVKIGVAAAMGVTSIVHGTLQFVEAAVEGVG